MSIIEVKVQIVDIRSSAELLGSGGRRECDPQPRTGIGPRQEETRGPPFSGGKQGRTDRQGWQVCMVGGNKHHFYIYLC